MSNIPVGVLKGLLEERGIEVDRELGTEGLRNLARKHFDEAALRSYYERWRSQKSMEKDRRPSVVDARSTVSLSQVQRRRVTLDERNTYPTDSTADPVYEPYSVFNGLEACPSTTSSANGLIPSFPVNDNCPRSLNRMADPSARRWLQSAYRGSTPEKRTESETPLLHVAQQSTLYRIPTSLRTSKAFFEEFATPNAGLATPYEPPTMLHDQENQSMRATIRRRRASYLSTPKPVRKPLPRLPVPSLLLGCFCVWLLWMLKRHSGSIFLNAGLVLPVFCDTGAPYSSFQNPSACLPCPTHAVCVKGVAECPTFFALQKSEATWRCVSERDRLQRLSHQGLQKVVSYLRSVEAPVPCSVARTDSVPSVPGNRRDVLELFEEQVLPLLPGRDRAVKSLREGLLQNYLGLLRDRARLKTLSLERHAGLQDTLESTLSSGRLLCVVQRSAGPASVAVTSAAVLAAAFYAAYRLGR